MYGTDNARLKLLDMGMLRKIASTKTDQNCIYGVSSSNYNLGR